MPKLLRYMFISFILFIPLSLFAQDLPLKLDLQPNKHAGNTFTLSLHIKANNAIAQGFELTFSKKLQIVPLDMAVNGANFWLKKLNESPEKPHVVHWFYEDSTLLIRYNAQDIAGDREITLNLLLARPLNKEEKVTISVFPLKKGVRKGALLKKVEMLLPKSLQN